MDAAQVLPVELPSFDLVVRSDELSGFTFEKVLVDYRTALTTRTA